MTATCVWPFSNAGFALFVFGLFMVGQSIGFVIGRATKRDR